MRNTMDRDERFMAAYECWLQMTTIVILSVARRIFPPKAYAVFFKLLLWMYGPLGRFVGWVYVYVRNFGDLMRWLSHDVNA
jgi:hypothetical protein